MGFAVRPPGQRPEAVKEKSRKGRQALGDLVKFGEPHNKNKKPRGKPRGFFFDVCEEDFSCASSYPKIGRPPADQVRG
jgi:hypothetical protein